MNEKVADSACAVLVPLLTADDLERLLQVDRRTIARLCKRGQLPPPLKLGGGNRRKSTDIVDAIEILDVERSQIGTKEENFLTAV